MTTVLTPSELGILLCIAENEIGKVRKCKKELGNLIQKGFLTAGTDKDYLPFYRLTRDGAWKVKNTFNIDIIQNKNF